MDELLALAYHQRAFACVIARLFDTVGPRRGCQYRMAVSTFVERGLARAYLTG